VAGFGDLPGPEAFGGTTTHAVASTAPPSPGPLHSPRTVPRPTITHQSDRGACSHALREPAQTPSSPRLARAALPGPT